MILHDVVFGGPLPARRVRSAASSRYWREPTRRRATPTDTSAESPAAGNESIGLLAWVGRAQRDGTEEVETHQDPGMRAYKAPANATHTFARSRFDTVAQPTSRWT